MASCRSTRTAGRAIRGRRTLTLGARVSAAPAITGSPRWLVQTQSSVTSPLGGRFSRTVTVAVTVSPMATGRRNLSAWPM